MVDRCSVMFLTVFSLFISPLTSIPCDFQFIECDSNDLMDSRNFTIPPSTTTSTAAPTPHDSFDCEQSDDFVVETTTTEPLDVQFLFPNTDEDAYEDIETTCQVRQRTIQPKALNNIYNQLTKVLNTASYVQSITIEQCLNKAEPCNSNVVPPWGKKHICRQKHVKITLKALTEAAEVVDEEFYYPSHCVCELVTVKKKIEQRQKCSLLSEFLKRTNN